MPRDARRLPCPECGAEVVRATLGSRTVSLEPREVAIAPPLIIDDPTLIALDEDGRAHTLDDRVVMRPSGWAAYVEHVCGVEAFEVEEDATWAR